MSMEQWLSARSDTKKTPSVSSPRSTPSSVARNLEMPTVSSASRAAAADSDASDGAMPLFSAGGMPLFSRVASVERSVFAGGKKDIVKMDVPAVAFDISDAAGVRSGHIERHISPVTWCEVGPPALTHRTTVHNPDIMLPRRALPANTSSPAR